MARRDPLARPEELISAIYAYVAYRLGSGPDADDVTSQTMEHAYRYRERYDPAKG
ncbi:MAG: sigma factor, partial [Gaiellaceae bacterium]